MNPDQTGTAASPMTYHVVVHTTPGTLEVYQRGDDIVFKVPMGDGAYTLVRIPLSEWVLMQLSFPLGGADGFS